MEFKTQQSPHAETWKSISECISLSNKVNRGVQKRKLHCKNHRHDKKHRDSHLISIQGFDSIDCKEEMEIPICHSGFLAFIPILIINR